MAGERKHEGNPVIATIVLSIVVDGVETNNLVVVVVKQPYSGLTRMSFFSASEVQRSDVYKISNRAKAASKKRNS